MTISPDPSGQAGKKGETMGDTIIVRRTGQAPLRIRGERLADQSSTSESASPTYSGSTGRCQRVRIYRTASGKHVVSIHHTTNWQGERGTDEAAVFPSLAECVQFLGNRVPGWMLQDIINELGEEEVAQDVI